MTLFTGGSENTSAFQVCQISVGEEAHNKSGQTSVGKIGEGKLVRKKMMRKKLVRKELRTRLFVRLILIGCSFFDACIAMSNQKKNKKRTAYQISSHK